MQEVLLKLTALIQSNVYVFVAFIVWGFIWKALALWKAARNNSKAWFVILLIVNTTGILEILYIFFLHKFNLDTIFINLKNKLVKPQQKG